jgi:nucleotide-binding universal stress UspA family protein
MADTLVLGYDGSEPAIAALNETIRLASQLRASVVVVFAYHVSPLGGTPGGSYREALERVGAHAIRRAEADLEAAGIKVESRLVSARPAEAIMAVADEVDARAIVVGTLGEGAITGTIFGSVVLKLLQRTMRPLLVVPRVP